MKNDLEVKKILHGLFTHFLHSVILDRFRKLSWRGTGIGRGLPSDGPAGSGDFRVVLKPLLILLIDLLLYPFTQTHGQNHSN